MLSGKLTPQGAVEYDGWEKVYETELETATDTVTISGLSGDTDEQYMLDLNGVDDTTVSAWSMRFNGDTGSNYGYQYLKGSSTTISASRSATTAIAVGGTNADDNITSSHNLIHAKSGYVRTVLNSQARTITGTTVTDIYAYGWSWNNTADELTSISVFATTDNMNIGSTISLYRRISS